MRAGAAAARAWLLCTVFDDSNGVSNGPSPRLTPLTDAAAGSRSTAAPANATAVRCPPGPEAGSSSWAAAPTAMTSATTVSTTGPDAVPDIR